MNTAERVFLDNNREAPMVPGNSKILQMVGSLSRVLPVRILPPVNESVVFVSRLSASLKGARSGWFECGLVLEHHGVRYQLMPLVVVWLERRSGDA